MSIPKMLRVYKINREIKKIELELDFAKNKMNNIKNVTMLIIKKFGFGSCAEYMVLE